MLKATNRLQNQTEFIATLIGKLKGTINVNSKRTNTNIQFDLKKLTAEEIQLLEVLLKKTKDS